MLGALTALITRPAKSAGAPVDPNLNRRAAQYLGQELVLQRAIMNGHGRQQMGGITWLIAGPELPAGTRVRVTGVEGPRLRVEAA